MKNRRHTVLTASIMIIIGLGIGAVVAFRPDSSEQMISAFLEKTGPDTDFNIEHAAFQKLLAQIGAREAQEVLAKHLPNNSRTHVLDHETGLYLYRTRGTLGIEDCLPYLAGGCYHGFIGGILVEKGYGTIAELVKECEAGLESEQTLQCAHGVGHAILEHVDYPNLPEAIEVCSTQFRKDQRAARNCYEGAFMENSFGTFSIPPPDRFYRPEDPMYPCSEPFVLAKEGAHQVCWVMLSQLTLSERAFPMFKGEPRLVATYCESLKAEQDRVLCYSGIARQFQLTHSGDDNAIRAMCATMPAHRVALCTARGFLASYMYGDRSSKATTACTSFAAAEKPVCYHEFYKVIAISFSSEARRREACETIPEKEFSEHCVEWLKTAEATNL